LITLALLVPLVVYVILPELHDFQGKVVIAFLAFQILSNLVFHSWQNWYLLPKPFDHSINLVADAMIFVITFLVTVLNWDIWMALK
jgi:hypothetical protein